MPTHVQDDDWIERPVQRLERLENSLSQGVKDQAELRTEVRGLREAVEGIQSTLSAMASDEIAELKRKAELPRRILYAVLVPVLVAAVTAVVGSLITGVHL